MKILGGIIIAHILLFSFQEKEATIARMNSTSFHSAIADIQSVNADLNDTLLNKTIKIYLDKNGFPIKYSRDISTGVCVDGECRLVGINLFWNVTGRYLGFELPNGEFLSKTEHDPFNAEEYDRLHELMAEANSPLASYTIEELVPEKDSLFPGVDAVTSATIEAVLDHIVEGAVYTTHTLWHIVYGTTKSEIEKLTVNRLNSELVLLILNSNNLKDQVWTLNHMTEKIVVSVELQNKLVELISGKDIYLAERSLNALKPEVVTDEIQMKLVAIFQSSGFLQKRLIIQKLKECDYLNPAIIEVLSAELNGLNGTLTKKILELYKVHSINDNITVLEVAKLLKNQNRYISNEALHFLKSIDNLDKKTEKAVRKYDKKNS